MSDKFEIESGAGAMAVTDEELIMRMRDGDETAFETLIDRYQKPALRLALRFTRRETNAEDLVQDSFLQVHCHTHQYDPGVAPFRTWFFTILSNLCRNAVRRNKSLSFIELFENAPAIGDPESELVNHERRAALATAVAKLPPNQRLALALRYEQGFRYAEMATAFGVSISAVRVLLWRAKRTLRRELTTLEKNSSRP
ncbi:MAG: sigma-70 family RNA polymerase sigma factor [Blastocatellia bacterium]|nr:sigma-70 family RNA polymerase sigma factor [Blastocatellia bacterium]